MLRNRQNLTEESAVRLDELLAVNAPLMTVYVLKNQFKELWYAPNEEEAYHRWNQWYQMAEQSRLAPLKRFAKRLSRYLEGINANARYRLSTGILVGMNNRINHKTYGLWIPGHRLLFSENQGDLSR